MFVNTHEFEITNADGNTVTVSLRLSLGAQLQLKKKWKETTTATLLNAVDDIERFVDVMDHALKWSGNKNEIKSGETLIDLMADNDMLGIAAKQELITSIGRVSGIFSEKEKQSIDKKANKAIEEMFADEEEAPKNA